MNKETVTKKVAPRTNEGDVRSGEPTNLKGVPRIDRDGLQPMGSIGPCKRRRRSRGIGRWAKCGTKMLEQAP